MAKAWLGFANHLALIACFICYTNSVQRVMYPSKAHLPLGSCTERKCFICLKNIYNAVAQLFPSLSLLLPILCAAAIAEDAVAALLPCAQDPPWPLGGRAVPANACMQLGKGLWQQLVTRVSFLLQCCNYLLTSPFPVPVIFSLMLWSLDVKTHTYGAINCNLTTLGGIFSFTKC